MLQLSAYSPNGQCGSTHDGLAVTDVARRRGAPSSTLTQHLQLRQKDGQHELVNLQRAPRCDHATVLLYRVDP